MTWKGVLWECWGPRTSMEARSHHGNRSQCSTISYLPIVTSSKDILTITG
ncbi:hypothetical protein LEMLEM_LOCUS7237 [Lemmus lemmus]